MRTHGEPSVGRAGAALRAAAPTSIDAKLERPEPPAGHILRPRLLERLDQSETTRLTLISAPAGYGKTTLVEQWRSIESPSATAWLSLDRLDNDLERFARCFIAALRRVDEGCLAATEELLSARNLPSPQYLAESMLFEIERLSRHTVLVLDDYGAIRANAVHELLGSMVPKLPPTLNLVITTRIDPPLPLSLWQSRHWLQELRAVDLRCSREETGALFAAADELDLSDEGIDRIHRKTEGWMGGLRLALLSLAGEADPEERVRAFSASDRLVADYLMEEVLAKQPTEIREFLAVSSALERFNAKLCDVLLAEVGSESAGRSREIIDRVFKQNLFLVSLGPTDGWYRYHHLFRELLLGRFDELAGGATKQDLLTRAGAWFCDQGSIDDGLKCYLAAGDVDAAEGVFGTHLREVMTTDPSLRTLARWMSLFPPDSERIRIPLLVAAGYLGTIRFDCDDVARILDVIDAARRDGGSDRHRKWLELFESDVEHLRAFVSFWKGDVEATREHSSRSLTEAADPREFRAAIASVYLGISQGLTGRWHEYLRFVERGTTGPGISDNAKQIPFLATKAHVHFYKGELAQCQAVAATVTNGLGFTVPKFYESGAHLLLGFVAYERNQLDEAERHFLAVESRRFDAMRLIPVGAALGLAQIDLARGHSHAAGQRAAQAHSFALESQSPTLVRIAEIFRQYITSAAGKPVDLAAPTPPDHDFTHLLTRPASHAWAWLQLRSRSAETRQAALDLIDAALERAEAYEATGRAIQLSTLRALALDAQGRRDEAISALEAALRSGADLGFVRSFVDCGEGIRSLLQAVAERNPDDEYVAMLLDTFAVSASHSSGAGEAGPKATKAGNGGVPLDDLTNREIDVLELLERRLTNREIAERLGISAATVKMHTLGIYRKLDVSGRRKAVVAAVERGILTC